MYVLYQQGIGISNVYFLHVATILWLFISTNSIVRIRSGLDRKVAKNKTEPHSGVQHSKKLSRSLSSEAEQKAELEEREQKMHVKKRPLNPSCCCSCSQGSRGSSSSLRPILWPFLLWQLVLLAGWASQLNCCQISHAELECVFMCGLQNSPPQQQSIHFLNFEFNWNCVS